MRLTRSMVVPVVLALLVLLAGCGQLLGRGGNTGTGTVTPAPVPEPTATDTDVDTDAGTDVDAGDGTSAVETETDATGRNGRALAGAAEGRGSWVGVPAAARPGVTQPRYLSLRPNCERPPGLVIHIQVAALGNNHPATDEGINTTWQFAAPSNRRVTGPYPAFVELVTNGYRPLLNASTVTYGPLRRDGAVATQRVTATADNETTSYTWRVERQSAAPYAGCWMTTSVVETDPGADRSASFDRTAAPE